MLVAVVAGDADADGTVLHEVHAVGRVALPDDQLAVDQRARQQRVREVGALVCLRDKSTYINSRLFPMGVGRNYRTQPATVYTYSSRLIHIHTSDPKPIINQYNL